MLAYAGVHRMEMNEHIIQLLDIDEFTPAVGQGTIAIEASKNLNPSKREAIRKACNDSDTEICLKAERAYLKKLEGGCSIPVFGNCIIKNNQLHLTGGIVSLDGCTLLKETLISEPSQAETLGIQLANTILKQGGDKILNVIKQQLES